MQRVFSFVRSILIELKLVVDGIIIMSENLRDVLDCMFDVRIFVRWKKVSIVFFYFVSGYNCFKEFYGFYIQ